MIAGIHALIYAQDAVKARAFLRDTLELEAMDAGEGWLIFALPPAELAVHPGEESGRHELYLMCDDVNAVIAKLGQRGVEAAPVRDAGWGLLTSFQIPGAGAIGLYQPRHPSPLRPNR